MTLKEAERLGVMKELERKKLTYLEASSLLKISRRQAIRIMKRYRSEGSAGVISKKKGHVSSNRYNPKQKTLIISIIREKYEDFGPTFASEKLKEEHRLEVSRETLRKWLIEEGLWKAKPKKEKKIHPRRTRRSQIGELVQIDGSYHAWFEERGEKCCLIIFIDDATSHIMYGKFCQKETTKDYMKGMRSYIEEKGKPQAIYSDKHSVFRINREEVKTGARETQFGRALRELNIELICANSPQAKGRVERANATLQDRLVKEMRLKGIKTIEEGNEYLKEFIEKHNKRFAVRPALEEDGHREVKENLEEVFSVKSNRKLTKNLSFHYCAKEYQIETSTPNRLKHKEVEIIDMIGGGVIVKYKGQKLNYSLWKEKVDRSPNILNVKELEIPWDTAKVRKPSRRHPWR